MSHSLVAIERLLDAQWALVRSYQSVDEYVAAALFHEEIDRAHARALATVTPLDPWPGLADQATQTFTSGPDLVRLRRVLDIVQHGDRVLEIGVGQGYMTGVLLRDREPAHYCGIDINQRLVDMLDVMAEANGLSFDDHHAEVRDLFTLTPGFVGEHAPDVILLLEVVEHVADPAAALRTVADAMNDEQILVFSVPLLGRIEACWGHVSLFDDRRIRRLCAQAGLRIQNVEVIQNHWVLIVASRGEVGPARLSWPVASPDHASTDADRDYDLHRLSLRASASDCSVEAPGRGSAVVTEEKVGVRVRLTEEGSIALRTPRAGVVRIDLAVGTPGDVDGLEVLQLDGDGRRVARWRTDGRPLDERHLTYILRPGVPSRSLHPVGGVADAEVHTTELRWHIRRGRSVDVFLRRVAFAERSSALLRSAVPVRRVVRRVGRGGVSRPRSARALLRSVRRRLRDLSRATRPGRRSV